MKTHTVHRCIINYKSDWNVELLIRMMVIAQSKNIFLLCGNRL